MAGLYKPSRSSLGKGARFSVPKGKVSSMKMPKGKTTSLKMSKGAKPKMAKVGKIKI